MDLGFHLWYVCTNIIDPAVNCPSEIPLWVLFLVNVQSNEGPSSLLALNNKFYFEINLSIN